MLTVDLPRARPPAARRGQPTSRCRPTCRWATTRRRPPRAAATPAWTFDDIGRFGELSGLPVVVKGVLRGDDAARCVQAGASAVWVSTHGGRQADPVVSSAAALPEVVDAVGDEVEVYADGGIRSGSDVLTALALGRDGGLRGPSGRSGGWRPAGPTACRGSSPASPPSWRTR